MAASRLERALQTHAKEMHAALASIFGGFAIQPANTAEFFVQSVMMVVGSALWSYIIAAGCGLISTLDPQGVEYRQTVCTLVLEP